ncbi:MAG: NAD-dependent epimerase/dehydratase family protein [Abitibacteriaceae bacterium]|nr:NAD-dependent epimerase/dehydratase family protein [Abditibacteriaceae bacterium]
MKRVIVTGATGFVGANLARHLLQAGYEVHLLVRPAYQSWRIESIQGDVHLHEVALTDAPVLSSTVSKIQPEWIFHLAAHGAYSWQNDLEQIVQTNFIGTLNFVEACLQSGFEAFVNTGSSSEYGFKDHAPAENEYLEPNSYYAVTKASATLFCRYTAQARGVHLPTLRLYSVYGPYEDPGRLMPTLIRHGLQGTWPPLVNPETARDYVYVDDVCAAYVLAATRPNQELGAVYNVGTGLQTPLHEVVSVAQRVLDIAAQPQWNSMPGRQWDTGVWVADNRKIVQELGWQPQYNLETGLRRMVQWMQDNTDAV